ncbi:40S ribosomal protein S5-1 [Hordeum vulgare]|nr:40S ribosomal protein S5-1 [Hordeum vulgare]
MRKGMLHIHDVEGPKKTRSVETRLEAMEKQVFKCQGMVERGLNANHMMITEFTNKHRIDANDIGKHLSRLYDRIDQLQAQIYDLQNQNCEYEYRFKSISQLRLLLDQGFLLLLQGSILKLHLFKMSRPDALHVGSMGGILLLQSGAQLLLLSMGGCLVILLLYLEKSQLLLETLAHLA